MIEKYNKLSVELSKILLEIFTLENQEIFKKLLSYLQISFNDNIQIIVVQNLLGHSNLNFKQYLYLVLHIFWGGGE
jgi:hypothetical protein